MAKDFTSEEIAHFIGSLKLISEEPRLRTEHDAFEHVGATPSNPGGFHSVTVTVAAPYDLLGMTAGIGYSVTPLPLPNPFFLQSVFLRIPAAPGVSSFEHDQPLPPVLPIPLPTVSFQYVTFEPTIPEFVLPPPSSIAVIIEQQSFLYDSDILGELDLVHATEDAQDLALDALIAAASSLMAGGSLQLTNGQGGNGSMLKATEAQPAPALSPLSHEATVHVLSGDAIFGIHSDGTILDEAPDLSALLPKLPDHAEEGAPEHIVITGGNTVVNQAFISFSTSDAPVIAVKGNSYSMTGIFQVNVLSDLDWINGADLASITSQNIVQNISSVLHLSSKTEEDIQATAGNVEDPVFPSLAAVVRIDGDLINTNQLQQFNYVVDNNIMSMEFTAAQTFIQSGGNVVANAVSLAELTYVYDMIVVGGDIIQHTVINQMNVLLDDDFVTYGPGANVDLVNDQNLLWNEAAINTVGVNSYLEMSNDLSAFGTSLAGGSDVVPNTVFSLDAFAGSSGISILYVEGDFVSYQSIDQVNIVANSDQVELPSAEAAMAAGAEISLTTGANALVNIAGITELGVDSDIHVGGEIYSDALMHQAGLVVAHDTEHLGESGGLVTEAVAFLMDNPEHQHSGDGDASYGQQSIPDEMGSDPMGGLLA